MSWISVKDRLPQGQEDVLFCSPSWGWCVVGMYSHGLENPWAEYDQQNDKYLEWESEPPTHWMPRPTPPKY